jgi:hypothetical protein
MAPNTSTKGGELRIVDSGNFPGDVRRQHLAVRFA